MTGLPGSQFGQGQLRKDQEGEWNEQHDGNGAKLVQSERERIHVPNLVVVSAEIGHRGRIGGIQEPVSTGWPPAMS